MASRGPVVLRARSVPPPLHARRRQSGRRGGSAAPVRRGRSPSSLAALARAAPPRPPRITDASATAITARSDQSRSTNRSLGGGADPCPLLRVGSGGSTRCSGSGLERLRGRVALVGLVGLVVHGSMVRPEPVPVLCPPSAGVHRKHTADSWTVASRDRHSGDHEDCGARPDPPRRQSPAGAGRRRRGEHRRAAADGAALRGLGRGGRPDRHQGRSTPRRSNDPTPSCST